MTNRRSDAIRPAFRMDLAMLPILIPILFPLGEVVITQGVQGTIAKPDVFAGLARHSTGDWGDLDEYDWKLNDDAIENGDRLLSRYSNQDGDVFWIITEHDRSVTTILLPGEY